MWYLHYPGVIAWLSSPPFGSARVLLLNALSPFSHYLSPMVRKRPHPESFRFHLKALRSANVFLEKTLQFFVSNMHTQPIALPSHTAAFLRSRTHLLTITNFDTQGRKSPPEIPLNYRFSQDSSRNRSPHLTRTIWKHTNVGFRPVSAAQHQATKHFQTKAKHHQTAPERKSEVRTSMIMSEASEMDVTCSSRVTTSSTMASTRSQTIRTVTKLVKQLTEGLKSLGGASAGNSKWPSEIKFPIRTKNTKETKVDNTKTNTALQQKQEEAWKLILQKHDHRESLVNHYPDLRRPNLSDRTG